MGSHDLLVKRIKSIHKKGNAANEHRKDVKIRQTND
jgi:hypothetical protein